MKKSFFILAAFLLIFLTGCTDSCLGSDINWNVEDIQTLSVSLSANSIQKNQTITVSLTGTLDAKYENCKIIYELHKEIDSKFKHVQLIYKASDDEEWTGGWYAGQTVAPEEFNSINKTMTLYFPAEGLYKIYFHFAADNSVEKNCGGEFSDCKAFIVEN